MTAISEAIKAKIRERFANYPNKQALTLPILHMVQDENRCVPEQAVNEIAELLELSPAQIYDTLSFYGFFKNQNQPLGKRRIWICRSLSCSLRGGEDLLANVCEHLHVLPGEATANGEATIELAECLGACDGAPCILVDDELQLNATVEDVVALAEGRA